jgi:hypothetical protein
MGLNDAGSGPFGERSIAMYVWKDWFLYRNLGIRSARHFEQGIIGLLIAAVVGALLL